MDELSLQNFELSLTFSADSLALKPFFITESFFSNSSASGAEVFFVAVTAAEVFFAAACPLNFSKELKLTGLEGSVKQNNVN